MFEMRLEVYTMRRKNELLKDQWRYKLVTVQTPCHPRARQKPAGPSGCWRKSGDLRQRRTRRRFDGGQIPTSGSPIKVRQKDGEIRPDGFRRGLWRTCGDDNVLNTYEAGISARGGPADALMAGRFQLMDPRLRGDDK